ncbi:hypothetical protein CERZMDRAFT_95463 [Cercospora zeae-maydis SCOH1-5]|uniref:Uncharacterized protein n=1 Tax=Cercospora zeae-maydis SCOH1-5 TaxID=717836 RepID=A0A6A6FLD4_9PEZI|nr:hypothetical protein CERZMDRAFT_95463 [Cercospora zeae-maydis SCOH1-5]
MPVHRLRVVRKDANGRASRANEASGNHRLAAAEHAPVAYEAASTIIQAMESSRAKQRVRNYAQAHPGTTALYGFGASSVVSAFFYVIGKFA